MRNTYERCLYLPIHGLYDFDNDKDVQAFFFLDDADAPFPKPPVNDKEDVNDGLIATLTN